MAEPPAAVFVPTNESKGSPMLMNGVSVFLPRECWYIAVTCDNILSGSVLVQAFVLGVVDCDSVHGVRNREADHLYGKCCLGCYRGAPCSKPQTKIYTNMWKTDMFERRSDMFL